MAEAHTMRRSDPQRLPNPTAIVATVHFLEEMPDGRVSAVPRSPPPHAALVTRSWVWMQEEDDLCSKLVMVDKDTWIVRSRCTHHSSNSSSLPKLQGCSTSYCAVTLIQLCPLIPHPALMKESECRSQSCLTRRGCASVPK